MREIGLAVGLASHGPASLGWAPLEQTVIAWVASPVLGGITAAVLQLIIHTAVHNTPAPTARAKLLQPLFVVTDPFLNLFRGLGLNFGGLDFSILPAFFLLNALTNAVPALGADASFLVDPSALM